MGNLNYTTKGDEIQRLFSEAGPVVSVSVPVDRETGRPRGFCFVEMATADGAMTAVARFNGHDLGGRPLRVNQAEERRRDDRPRPPRPEGFGDRPPPRSDGPDRPARSDGADRPARPDAGDRPPRPAAGPRPRRFGDDGGWSNAPGPGMFDEPPPPDSWGGGGGGDERRGGSGKGKSRRNLRRNKRSL